MAGAKCNRAALASFLCGDWFLAIHAGNYFAKEFLPKSHNHVGDASSLGIETSRVCLSCWHRRRQMCWEDEVHVILDCPEYDSARSLFLQQVSECTRAQAEAACGSRAKLVAILSTTIPEDWKTIGEYFGRVRQKRRHIRQRFQARQAELTLKKFEHRRAAWQQRGRFACRHGVLFDIAKGSACPCMTRSAPSDAWQHAKYMAVIDHDLKAIVTRQFDLPSFRRLGQLRAELRKLNYT